MASADEAVLRELAEWNTLFEQRFGHVFVICATGVPAGVVLAELKRRYGSAPHAELRFNLRHSYSCITMPNVHQQNNAI